LKNPAAPLMRDLRWTPASWLQGMFCLAAVLRATVRSSANFLIRSLTFTCLWQAAAPLGGIFATLRQAAGNALAVQFNQIH